MTTKLRWGRGSRYSKPVSYVHEFALRSGRGWSDSTAQKKLAEYRDGSVLALNLFTELGLAERRHNWYLPIKVAGRFDVDRLIDPAIAHELTLAYLQADAHEDAARVNHLAYPSAETWRALKPFVTTDLYLGEVFYAINSQLYGGDR